MSSPLRIAVINQTSVITDKFAVAKATAAVHKQILNHVAPAWGHRSISMYVYEGDPGKLPHNVYPCYLQDDADVQGALGYHDVDPYGKPYIRVFVKTCMKYGMAWESCFSHEIIELFLDFDCNLFAIDTQTGILYAVEGCDAVEADEYDIDGVTVSNFILPEWFNRNHPVDAKFDYLGKLTQPFSMNQGGYLIYMKGNPEQQKFAEIVLDAPDVPEWKKEYKWNAAARTVKKLEALNKMLSGAR